MSRNPVVLNIAKDAELRRLRELMLRAQGLDVISPEDEGTFAKSAKQPADALVVCYRLSAKVRNKIAAAFREVNPKACIIELTRDQWQAADIPFAIQVEAFQPEELVRAVKRAVQEGCASSAEA